MYILVHLLKQGWKNFHCVCSEFGKRLLYMYIHAYVLQVFLIPTWVGNYICTNKK
jgi:hypothetical protein